MPVTATVLLLPSRSSADATEQAGLASLTADLLDEGSRGQSALEISDRIARMGGDLDLEVSHDATVISLATLDRFLDRVCRWSTRSARFRTWRSRISSACGSSGSSGCDSFAIILRRSPTARAQLLYSRIHAQPGHGTARRWGPDTVRRAAVSRGDVPAGWRDARARRQPSRRAPREAAAAFDGWRGDPDVAVIARDRGRLDPPRAPSARLAIVPAPARPQSELGSGTCPRRAGPLTTTRWCFSTLLGGQFVSRLNMNLREDKGYTYGVRTGFDLRRGDGPFVLQTSVGTEVTVSALGEAFNELREIRDGRPVTADELALAKSSVTLGYPRGFKTVQQIARAVAQLASARPADSYFEEFVPRIEAVTLGEVAAAAAATWTPIG